MPYIIATDIGATNARMTIKDIDTGKEHTVRKDGFSLEQIDNADIPSRLKGLIMPKLSQLGLEPQNCAGICLGAAGIDTQQVRELTENALVQMGIAARACMVYNDCEVILRAGGKADIFIAAGTGSIVLAIDKQGTLLRRSGWGHFTSDDGSGSSVALSALRYASAVWDESADGNAFTRVLTAHLGVRTPLELEQLAIHSAQDKSRLASIAPLVCEHALNGDVALCAIFDTSAQALCKCATQLSSELKINRPRVMLWGSMLLKCEILRDKVTELLHKQLDAQLVSAQYSALEAAVMLASERAASLNK